MTISTAKNLQGYIEELLGTHQLLDSFQKTKHFCAVIGIYGARHLHIERHGNRVTVAQYIVADDDLLPSPEIIHQIDERGGWSPTEAHFTTQTMRNCVDGSWFSNLRERFYIRKFSRQWLKRLVPQMYERGEVLELWGENE